jgi:hypothetical protein
VLRGGSSSNPDFLQKFKEVNNIYFEKIFFFKKNYILLFPLLQFQTSLLVAQRLENNARRWQNLKHPNVSEFFGLAFNFGYMPALILPFYGNVNVVEYVMGKNDEVKLHMVLISFCSSNHGPADGVLCRWDK